MITWKKNKNQKGYEYFCEALFCFNSPKWLSPVDPLQLPPQLGPTGWKFWMLALVIKSVPSCSNLGSNDCTHSWGEGTWCFFFFHPTNSFTGFAVLFSCPHPSTVKLAHSLLVLEVVCPVWSWREMINDSCGWWCWSCRCQGAGLSAANGSSLFFFIQILILFYFIFVNFSSFLTFSLCWEVLWQSHRIPCRCETSHDIYTTITLTVGIREPCDFWQVCSWRTRIHSHTALLPEQTRRKSGCKRYRFQHMRLVVPSWPGWISRDPDITCLCQLRPHCDSAHPAIDLCVMSLLL